LPSELVRPKRRSFRIGSTPFHKRGREAEAAFAVGEAEQAVLAPAIGAAARVVVREIIPAIAVGRIILAHRAPLPLGQIGPPALPVFGALLADLNDLYTLQKEVADQYDRVKTGLEAVARGITTAQAQLFKQTKPELWQPAAFAANGTGAMSHERESLVEQAAGVRDYLAERPGTLLAQVFLLVLLIATFYGIRNAVREHAKTEEGLRDAEHIFDVPVANALLLTLVACNFLYPVDESPRLLWSVIGTIALGPTIVIVRRLISPDLRPLLYATVAAYFIDQVRYAATPAGVFARTIFLGELLAACLFILATLRSKRLCVTSPNPLETERIVRFYLHTAFFVFLFAGFANLFGYVALSFIVGNGMLQSSYSRLSSTPPCASSTRIVLAAMSLRPISTFGMVRRHHDLVYARWPPILRWIATALWAVVRCRDFSSGIPSGTRPETSSPPSSVGVRSRISSWGDPCFSPHGVGRVRAVAFIRFALEEDVYPNLNLPRGIPYAISTWCITPSWSSAFSWR
jgi:hypothetical protein